MNTTNLPAAIIGELDRAASWPCRSAAGGGKPDGLVAHVEPWSAGSWRHVQDWYQREVCLEG